MLTASTDATASPSALTCADNRKLSFSKINSTILFAESICDCFAFNIVLVSKKGINLNNLKLYVNLFNIFDSIKVNNRLIYFDACFSKMDIEIFHK